MRLYFRLTLKAFPLFPFSHFSVHSRATDLGISSLFHLLSLSSWISINVLGLSKKKNIFGVLLDESAPNT